MMLCSKTIREVLSASSIFSRLAPDGAGTRQLCRVARRLELPLGDVLFREGDLGDSLYLLAEGEIRILKDDVEVIRLRERGACVGEMALISEEPRSATVECSAPTTLYRIDREDFFRALERNPSVVRGLFATLSNRLREHLQEKLKIERREIARREALQAVAEIQESLMPAREIQRALLTTAGYSRPYDIVGGDYYDYLHLTDGRTAVLVADVMDHGLHSAMLMAMLKSALHTYASFDASVGGVLRLLNRIVDEQVGIYIYLTCCYVIFDLHAGTLEYANAGNPPILLYRAADDQVLELESTYSPPGLMPPDDEVFVGTTLPWQVGDTLVVYSDGVLDVKNPQRQSYGLDRLKACLSGTRDLAAAQILNRVLSDVELFRQGAALTDDTTLVVAKAQGPGWELPGDGAPG